VQALVNDMAARVSPRTVEYVLTVLKQVFTYAVRERLLARNPCEFVTRPRKNTRPVTKHAVLSGAQMQTLLRSSAESRDYALWLLLLTTGLRPGEALGLQWSDLEDDTLTIRRTLVRQPDGRSTLVDGAKTDGSLRTVPLPAFVITALKAHRLRSGSFSLVFSNRRGNLESITNVSRRWHHALKKAGLPDMPLYHARHSHATWLLNEGGQALELVANRLGHANTLVTQRAYAKVLPETARKVAHAVEELLLGKK
jgi:integrase